MLLLQEPKDKTKLIAINNYKLNVLLQLNGYCPKYLYNKTFYYTINQDILDYISLLKQKK